MRASDHVGGGGPGGERECEDRPFKRPSRHMIAEYNRPRVAVLRILAWVRVYLCIHRQAVHDPSVREKAALNDSIENLLVCQSRRFASDNSGALNHWRGDF